MLQGRSLVFWCFDLMNWFAWVGFWVLVICVLFLFRLCRSAFVDFGCFWACCFVVFGYVVVLWFGLWDCCKVYFWDSVLSMILARDGFDCW